MKILLVNRGGYSSYGSETYLLNLYRLLKEKAHKVNIFTTKDERNIDKEYVDYFVNKIDIEKLDSVSLLSKILFAPKTIYSFEAKRKIERLIRDIRPDIVHIQNIKRSISPSILHSVKKYDIPVVYTLHDYHLICPNYRLFSDGQICENCKAHSYYNAILKRCVRDSFVFSSLACIEQYLHSIMRIFENYVDIFITPSSFLRQKMIEFGFNPKKLLHISNFIFNNDYQPNYESAGYIIYIGRLVREKGIFTLLQAVRNLSSLKLLIIGDGTYKKDLERLVAKEGINNVEFRGYLSAGDIKTIIKNAMFTVVPSEWYEIFGLVVLESFAMGKPVIGANIGAIPELVDDGINGLLFKSGDVDDLTRKIDYLFNNKDKILKMGQAARKKVLENYNPEIHYEKILQAYQKLIG